MLEKLKKQAIQMNLKKAVTCFIAAGIFLAVAFSVILYHSFRDRFDEWETTRETDYEYERQEEWKQYQKNRSYLSADKEEKEIDFHKYGKI